MRDTPTDPDPGAPPTGTAGAQQPDAGGTPADEPAGPAVTTPPDPGPAVTWHSTAAALLGGTAVGTGADRARQLLEHAATGLLHQPGTELALLLVDHAVAELAQLGAHAPPPEPAGRTAAGHDDVTALLTAAAELLRRAPGDDTTLLSHARAAAHTDAALDELTDA